VVKSSIHLGDIYPVGRRPFYDSFLADWRPGRLGSFNLNSNHDMFGGGKGYFEAGLRHESFAAQLGTSYFSVEFGDWILIGLDSAYHDTSPMFDACTVSDPDQTAFLREIREQVDRTGQKTFVMCHHNGLNLEGTEATNMWNDIVAEDALGKAPDVWYYGHQHIGVVYSTGSAGGPDPLIRCIGHSGLLFAASLGVQSLIGHRATPATRGAVSATWRVDSCRWLVHNSGVTTSQRGWRWARRPWARARRGRAPWPSGSARHAAAAS
jgi:hypothetical protein